MVTELVISTILWSTLAVVVSQGLSIAVMAWLGLTPKKLVKEIEDVQNPAVGACFFIISLTASFFISLVSSSGFTPDPTAIESIAWVVGGVILATIYTAIIFLIAHRIMGTHNENVYQYVRREIVDEQNAALAFFLGGLAITPFIAVLFQII